MSSHLVSSLYSNMHYAGSALVKSTMKAAQAGWKKISDHPKESLIAMSTAATVAMSAAAIYSLYQDHLAKISASELEAKCARFQANFQANVANQLSLQMQALKMCGVLFIVSALACLSFRDRAPSPSTPFENA